MIQYRRKYNSKIKHNASNWGCFDSSFNTISKVDWHIFEFKLNDIIYRSPSKAFVKAYEQMLMWERIQK